MIVRSTALITLISCWAILTPVLPASNRGKDSLVALQFPNADVKDVVQLYEKLTGFRIVQDNFVQGKITVTTQQPVEREKAIELIEKTLMSNGYSLVQTEKDVVQIVGMGKNPRSVGIPIISDP